MDVQVLLSAMNQLDHQLLKNTNIRTDAIIINQANTFKKETICHLGKNIEFLTFDDRGVGMSRNNALMRSNADIVIFADEDIRYVDNYEEIIKAAFEKNPKADMILFNVPSKNPKRPTYMIKSNKRVRRYSCLRYGAVKIAARTQRIKEKNIYFSLLFGGGAKYSSGEDSLFLYDAIKNGLKIYSDSTVIGYVSQEKSSWFTGYSEQFFIDKGVLYYHLSPFFSHILATQYVIRKYRKMQCNLSLLTVIKLVNSGVNYARKV